MQGARPPWATGTATPPRDSAREENGRRKKEEGNPRKNRLERGKGTKVASPCRRRSAAACACVRVCVRVCVCACVYLSSSCLLSPVVGSALCYHILSCIVPRTYHRTSYTVHRTPYTVLSTATVHSPVVVLRVARAPRERATRGEIRPATCIVCARARPVGRQRPPTTQSQAHHHSRHTLRNLRRASQSQLHTVPGASSVLAPKWRVRGSRCVVRGSRISGPGHGSGCCVSDTVIVGIYYIYIKHGCGHWHQEIEIGEGWLPPRVFVRAPARRARRR